MPPDPRVCAYCKNKNWQGFLVVCDDGSLLDPETIACERYWSHDEGVRWPDKERTTS